MSSQVATITLLTNAVLALTSENRTNLNTLDWTCFDFICNGFGDFFTCSNDELTSCWVNNIVNTYTSKNTLTQRRDNFITIFKGCTYEATECTTVCFIDNHIMANIHQTACQITSIGSLQSGIGQTLTSTVSRDKVLQHAHTFLEVRKNWVLNNLRSFCTSFLGLSHQTTHTCQLSNLVSRTTGTRIQHHEHGIETLVGFCHLFHQCLLQVGINVCPRINYLIVTLLVCNETHIIVGGNLINLIVTTLHNLFLLNRNDDIIKVE